MISLVLLYSSALFAQYGGIEGEEAPEWDIEAWLDGSGELGSYKLSDFAGKKIVVFCFQSWCPGCHKSGFPTMKYLNKRFGDQENVEFVAIQTVFEGADVNNFKKLKKMQKKYKLNIPFGHDIGTESSHIVERYRTGGTPWFIVINESGKVVYNHYELTPQVASRLLK
ncbi:MAG: redoxin family protein [Bacteroidia bacterium]|nr:redoxin family protein [Bacteroidia bacterium]